MLRTFGTVLVLGCVAAASPAQQAWDLDGMLWRLGTLQWLHRAPQVGERCVQFSSYDRRSDRGPDAPGAWYANHDRGNYLAVVDGDGGKEHVVDAQGPGCLARLWSANPHGTLHFDV
ncbi:MAG: hypothetical protein KAI24_02790, partial [Planctomycetes bacterium]|nr:hypothetical protein [Planctomycetota bacterium]